MNDFVQTFRERLQEIEIYLDLLQALEQQVQLGPPRIGENGPTITVQQQRILYSSVFLQLYNLVEATITRCVDAVSTAVVEMGPWMPGDLSVNLRREWVRFMARTHEDLSYENRLASAFRLCDQLVQALPVSDLKVEKGGGGNWDDHMIEDLTERLGLPFVLNQDVLMSAKQHFRNEQGSLTFVKNLRNNLAHGRLSFAECGEGITVSELRDLKDRTALYLQAVIAAFRTFIDSYGFLMPERRPQGTGTST